MHLVDGSSPTLFVFKCLYFWVEILYVYGKPLHSCYIRKPAAGVHTANLGGERDLAGPRIVCYWRNGALFMFTSLSSSQGDLCFKRRKRKKHTTTLSYCCLSLLHLIFSLRAMKCIDADNEQYWSVWLFSLFLCTLIMLLELVAD